MTGPKAEEPSNTPNPPTEAKLNLRQLNPKDFAAELDQRAGEVEEAVARIEAAKVIRQDILDMEISI